MKYRWTIQEKVPQKILENFRKDLKINDVFLSLLYRQGVSTYEAAYRFFRPSVTHLHSPFLMKDMERAVRRIEQALTQGEQILVYGDYDVDGTTSVAMMSCYLERFSDKVATYIPDRHKEGYGISLSGIDFASDNDITLIIALDCGIKAVDKAAYARQKGIDMIICDHHLPGQELPDVVAILNPKQKDCDYPFKELSGCGIGFKLIEALEQSRGGSFSSIENFLEWVAISIAADLVPVTQENRTLLQLGLEHIRHQPSYGVSALLGQEPKAELSVSDLVFTVAPRINVAGRMHHASHALELLKSTSQEEAHRKAIVIEHWNQERKLLDGHITREALQQIQTLQEEHCCTTVVFGASWHKGVIGIVASRLMETYYRPTLVFTESEGKLIGSARSVEGFDIYEALLSCSSYLLQFGGHKYAAGLTLEKEHYQSFKAAFEKVVSTSISSEKLQPELTISQELSLREITPLFNTILKQFSPFGPGHRTPVFLTHHLCGFARRVGGDGAHLKVKVWDDQGNTFDGIAFGAAPYVEEINSGRTFSIAYCIEENHWQGRTAVELRIKDFAFEQELRKFNIKSM